MTQILKGKTALVTGSTRKGIGATTAMMLALKGANVILNYGTGSSGVEAQERAIKLSKIIKAAGGHVSSLKASIDSEEDVKELFQLVSEHFGPVDILVNNAAGAWMEQDFADIQTEHWNQALRTDVDGTFFCIRQALFHMRQNNWGRIINVCLDFETMGLLINAQYGNVLEKYPYDFVLAKYAKSKMTEILALPELKYGITVNNILPGIIEEIDNERAMQIIQNEKQQSIYFNPVDVANAIVYLCRDEARGITGSDIRIPGNIYRRL